MEKQDLKYYPIQKLPKIILIMKQSINKNNKQKKVLKINTNCIKNKLNCNFL
jgi:hypothetical protein